MSSSIPSYLGSAWDIVNPLYAAVGCAAVLGAGALGYKLITRQSKEESSFLHPRGNVETQLQNRIKEVMDKLLITEYYLPMKGNETSEWSPANRPRPIFDEETKKEISIITKMIEKAIHHQSPLPNIILKGPSGVGKTMLGEDLCHRTGIGFIRIPSGAMEKHIKTGNHITAFRDVVKAAEESTAPTYLIMDDGEELIAQRPESQKPVDDSTVKAPWLIEQERLSQTIAQRRTALVNAILEESGKDYRKIGFCITTNRPDIIDSAFGTRARILAIKSPNTEERKQIIITHLPTIFKFDNDMLSFFNKGRLEDMSIKNNRLYRAQYRKDAGRYLCCVQLENGNITQDIVDASILAMKASVEKTDSKEPTVGHSVRQLGKSIFNKLSF